MISLLARSPSGKSQLVFGKVEFGGRYVGVLSHEFSQDILLLLLIAAGLTHLLLALIVHHFLNHAAGRTIQITEFAVLGLNL